MNERQAYALTHPITDPADPREHAKVEAGLKSVRRHGAGWLIMSILAVEDRLMRFHLPLPDRNAREFTHSPARGLRRSADAAAEAYEQGIRQRWRALALMIKAKLEAVEAGITTVEQEFLAHIVLPGGSTVGEWAAPQLALAYESKQMPALMPGVTDR